MFSLDIRTLSFITMLFCFIFFVGLLVFAKFNKRFQGLTIFAYANFLLFLGFLFLSLRDLVPDVISIVFANFLISFSFFLYFYGSSIFLRAYIRFLWIHIFGLILVLGGMVYFSFFQINANWRIIIVNTFLFSESLLIAIFYIRQSNLQFKTQKLSVAWGFLIYASYSLFRIIWTVNEIRIDTFLQAGIVHGLNFVFIQILIINTAFSLMWIANSILNNDLETQARLDPLTKMLNRRAFNDELNKELARSRRESITFSLIMADIDHFKDVNDNFGHLAGDSILISFTKIVTENLRINDIFARYGGEEFLILLPNTEKKYAAETAERIRKIVEMSNHPFNGKDISYTVSLGVTAFDIDAQNRDELLEKVDNALYEAKTGGRNRVEIK